MGFIKYKNTVNENGQENNKIVKAIQNHFSPEFLGRLDDIVYYNILSKDVIKTLALRYLEEFNKRAELNIKFTDNDLEEVLAKANIETQGARGVRKAVKNQIVVVKEREESTIETDF